MANRSPRRVITTIIVLSVIGFGLFFGIKGCSDDISPDTAGILLETKGKKYLFSPVGSVAVEQSIAEEKSPQAFPNVPIYKDGDDFYVNPTLSKDLVHLMSGSYTLFDFKEKSYDGYVTTEFDDTFLMENSYESTEIAGKQKALNVITLKNKKGEEMEIIWEQDPSTGEYKAIKNCSVRGFWTQTNPSPGETVVSSEDRFVISIKKLARFFGCRYSYDRETKILTVKR